jgi:hypothetical protein
MTSTVLASLVPLPVLKSLSPKPNHKKRADTGERSRLQKQRATGKPVVNMGNLPAVMPAGMGGMMGDLPQAVRLAAKGGTV